MRCGVSLGKASIKARYSRGRVQRAGRESPISEYACCFSCSDFQVCTLAQASEKRQWADIAGLFLPGGGGIPLGQLRSGVLGSKTEFMARPWLFSGGRGF